MQEYIRKLKAIIADEVTDCDSVLDSLFWVHCEKAEGDSGAVQQIFEEIHEGLQGLSHRQIERIDDLLNDLAWEHERRGFIDGFKIGIRLEQEVLE